MSGFLYMNEEIKTYADIPQDIRTRIEARWSPNNQRKQGFGYEFNEIYQNGIRTGESEASIRRNFLDRLIRRSMGGLGGYPPNAVLNRDGFRIYPPPTPVYSETTTLNLNNYQNTDEHGNGGRDGRDALFARLRQSRDNDNNGPVGGKSKRNSRKRNSRKRNSRKRNSRR